MVNSAKQVKKKRKYKAIDHLSLPAMEKIYATADLINKIGVKKTRQHLSMIGKLDAKDLLFVCSFLILSE